MKILNDAFNAKHLKIDQLVEAFVPSSKFDEVAQCGHTLLFGPRGSGKTTLLRMLSAEALPYWNHKKADEYRSVINYEGIYVPGDLVWADMLRSLEQLGAPDDCASEFSYAAFCTHVFISTIQTMESSLEAYVSKHGIESLDLKSDQLIEAYITIARILKLEIKKFSLSRIRTELFVRFAEIGEYPSHISGNKSFNLDILRKDLPFSSIQLKSTLDAIFDCFDRALGRPDHRWALLLDEFEIAPKILLDSVIQNMRSSARKTLFKVALVPCGNHQEVQAEISQGNDHKVVELWYRSRSDLNEFCNNLLKSKYSITQPEKIFGRTKYINNTHGGDDVWESQFLELALKDGGFKKYLDDKSINVKAVFSGDEEKTSEIRKIAPRVAFRNAFLSTSGQRKGRKSLHEFYSGWDAISRISEGNPRWLIATVDSLLATTDSLDNEIPQEKQYQIILSTCETFASMIASTALKNNMGISTNTPPYALLESIGDYFNNLLVSEAFSSDPAGTFIVDKQVNKDCENALRIALNHGAIVALDKGQDFWNYSDLYGMRFRISYLLSPKFELPLRMEKKLNLSTIISRSKSTKPSKKTERESALTQRGLFDEN